MRPLIVVEPAEIEARSFSIIETEFFEQTSIEPESVNNDMFQVIRRVIHATGDFSFAQNLVFHTDAVKTGLDSIRSGKNIYFDVTMGASGVSKRLLDQFGGQVICYVNDKKIAATARKNGKTRTETALEKISKEDVGIIAVGNAPTALVAAMDLIEKGIIKPDLLIGVPVGFVNAEESKEILSKKGYPFITNKGRKGGSAAAVAIVNALLRLAS